MALRVRAMRDTEVKPVGSGRIPGRLRRARLSGRASCGWPTTADACRPSPRSCI